MRMPASRPRWALATLFVVVPLLALTLVAQQSSSSLTIPGQSGSARVVQVNGRNYVEVEGLARISNSSLSFNGSQIILVLPGTSANIPTSSTGFSKEFLAAAIEALAQIREWHAGVRNAIERGTPVTSDWLTPYRTQAQQAVRLTAVAVNTSADKSAMPALSSEFETMAKLSDKYVQIFESRTNIRTDALANDTLEQKVRNCGRALASIASSNQFVDDGSCFVPVNP
jgi:hypothetical protein